MVSLSTIASPSTTDVGFHAPNFSIRVEGGEIPLGVRQLVKNIEYESADGLADVLKVLVWDPDFIPPKGTPGMGAIGGLGAAGGGSGTSNRLVDTKIFQPGNEITVAFGYGTQLVHIGRGIIRKMRPTFPKDSMPTIEVIAYTKDALMMDNAPEGSKKKKGKGGRRFKEVKFSDAVKERAADYGFEIDVDDTPDAPHNFIQKVGLTDYDFINGLSNLTGYVFWVDGDTKGTWTLHFRNPETIKAVDVWVDEKPRKYTFRYNDGNLSSLLAFEPELAIQGSITKLKVQVKDPVSGRTLTSEFTEENNRAPETTANVSGETLSVVDQALNGEHSTGSDVKIYLNDFSFEERSNRRFSNEAELTAWARQWFRRQRENFVMARGLTIGIEYLRARQTHAINGIGPSLSGDYYFSRVRHMMSSDQGYLCDFNCRKVVPPLP